jgi:hypothetical protein
MVFLLHISLRTEFELDWTTCFVIHIRDNAIRKTKLELSISMHPSSTKLRKRDKMNSIQLKHLHETNQSMNATNHINDHASHERRT